MEPSLLDSEIIEHLKEMFSSIMTPDQETLDAIYSEIDTFFTTNENFCFDVLAIAADASLPDITRTVAIFVLKAHHKMIPPSVIPQFIEYAFSFLEEVIHKGTTLFINEANSFYCLLFKFYGKKHYGELYPVIVQLLENEGTVAVGLQCMIDIIGCGEMPDLEVVSPLVTFISNEYATTNEALLTLTIIRMLVYMDLETYLSLIGDEFLPVIDANTENYGPQALNEVFFILGVFYYNTKDEDLGNLIGQIIQGQDPSNTCDMLNYFIEIEHFPFNENICCALYNRLEEPDLESDMFGVCSTCMLCLNIMYREYNSQVWEVLCPLLSECQNDGQILRTLSNISTKGEDLSEFIPFIMSHMEDENRGEAAILFINICMAVPELTTKVLDVLLPMILDEDIETKDKVFFALEELLPCENEKPEWFEFLVSTYKETEDVIYVSRIILQYLDGITELDAGQVNELLQTVLERYFSEDHDTNRDWYVIILLIQLLARTEDQSAELITSIIGHGVELLSSTGEIAGFEELYRNMYESVCTLVDSLCQRYGGAVIEMAVFRDFMNAFTVALSERKLQFAEDGSFAIIQRMFESFQEVAAEFWPSWATSTAASLPLLPIQYITRLIEFWDPHVEDFDQNITLQFAVSLCQVFSTRFPEAVQFQIIFEFLKKMIERLTQFGALPEAIGQFFEALCSHLSSQEPSE